MERQTLPRSALLQILQHNLYVRQQGAPKKIPVNRCTQQTTSTPASQPAYKTSSNKDTSLKSHSVASPVSLKSSIQHVGVKNVTSPKLESIIRTLKSKKTPSYSSPNPCTENSDSLFDRGTCASSGSDAGEGDIPKRKKRKKSIDVGGKNKQRLDKTEKMSEQPTPSQWQSRYTCVEYTLTHIHVHALAGDVVKECTHCCVHTGGRRYGWSF